MTISQGGEFIQRLVKNGFIRGRDTLKKEDYMNLVILARDYVLFQKKNVGELLSTNSSVVSIPKEYKITNGNVILPPTLNIQGLVTLELLTASKNTLDHSIFPLYAGAKNMVDNFFTYYIPMAGNIEFKNLPFNAKWVRIYNIAGADLNDTVSNDVMWLIIQQAMKLGQLSEEKRKDTSADGAGQDDAIQTQIRLQDNQPNNLV